MTDDDLLTTRPTVDEETLGFLRDLTNSGVFKLQYDAWAFGAALALKKNLEPKEPGSGRDQLPIYKTLNEDARFALEQATLAMHSSDEIDDFVSRINRLALAGLKYMKSEFKDLSTQEKINWVMESASAGINIIVEEPS